MNHNIINLVAAVVLSFGIIFSWQHFYEKPRIKKLQEQAVNIQKNKNLKNNSLFSAKTNTDYNEVEKENRIKIESAALSGSISLKGLRFDDLVLKKYKQDLAKNSPEVVLLARSNSENAYFAELGWISSDSSIQLPNSDTVWRSDNDQLTPEKPVNLSWVNNDGVKFLVSINLDENYLFSIKQTIINDSNKDLAIQSYGLINRKYFAQEKVANILYQGPIGCIDNKLQEYSYDTIKEQKGKNFTTSVVDWVGITDKYWLVSLIPDKSSNYSSNFNYAFKQGTEKYQVDFVSQSQIVKPGTSFSVLQRIFAGAKKVDLLDKYEKQYNIKLFDRAIDFGWFYVITKPVFYAMNFFYRYIGNFGISILIVTIIIKLLMFTLANRAYRSMKKMKNLQPEIVRIKKLYGDDKVKLNQEVMSLYKKEKINPVAGCLPILVQIPVFFSIYKVLYVTIEMRHAPFYGWIKDLSAPDPTTIFNLFGLIPFSPPSFLMIGAWPILMAITMFLQQKMSPEPADPVQAKVMKFMPLIFLVTFGSFPAGLLIYWSWNNILSIVQQYCINKLDK